MRKKIKKIAERFKAVEASVDRNVAKMEYKMEVKVLMVPSQQPGVDVVVCFVSFELLEDATPDDSGVAFFLFRVSILCRFICVADPISYAIKAQIQIFRYKFSVKCLEEISQNDPKEGQTFK